MRRLGAVRARQDTVFSEASVSPLKVVFFYVQSPLEESHGMCLGSDFCDL